MSLNANVVDINFYNEIYTRRINLHRRVRTGMFYVLNIGQNNFDKVTIKNWLNIVERSLLIKQK